jgi:hypothetical protein
MAVVSTLLATCALLAAQPVINESTTDDAVQVMPVYRAPESSTVVLALALPQQGDFYSSNPVWVQFRIDGYALGMNSPGQRGDELAQSDMGQTLHVVVDSEPYIAVKDNAIDPFNEEGYYYDTSYKFKLPFRLDDGMHTIRMFPARSYGESLKGENTYQAISFYVGSKKNRPEFDLSKPYLTYNEPTDQIYLTDKKPVLLDFYISNCELSPDGYKVRLTIDGKVKRTLSSWQPYYIYGLDRGKHTVRLQLIDRNGKIAPGAFNDVERTIRIH